MSRNRNKIRLKLIEEAIGEQLKSQAAEDGLEKGKRGTIAIPQQIVGSRRRMDDIISDLIDEWSDPNICMKKNHSAQYRNQSQNTTGSSSKHKTHRGRRSKESIKKRVNGNNRS